MRIFQFIALVLFLASCTTARDIQGDALYAELEPLADTTYYQGGATSLPAARKFARKRAQAFLDASNRMSWTRLLSLGVTGRRSHQQLLDRGASAISCLVSATDPYYTRLNRVEHLFGIADTGAARQAAIARLRGQGVSETEITRISKDIPANTGLLGELRAAIGDVQDAQNMLRLRHDLPDAQTDDATRARLDAAFTQSTIAIAEEQVSADELGAYRAGLDNAGAALASRVRDIILVMSKELRRLEPDPDAAAASFSSIQSSFGASLESFNAVDILALLSTFATTAETTGPKAAQDRGGEDRAFSNLFDALTKLDRIATRARDEVIVIRAQISASASKGDCADPAGDHTLLVTPQGASQTLAAGDTATLIIIVGGSASPSATELNDRDDAITITGPTAVAGAPGHFEVHLTAKSEVAETTTAKVVITSDKTLRAVVKMIIITAAKQPARKNGDQMN